MHPYFASRLAEDRDREVRRRAETYRLLAEGFATGPHRRKLVPLSLRPASDHLRSVRRWGRRRIWWPIEGPVAPTRRA